MIRIRSERFDIAGVPIGRLALGLALALVPAAVIFCAWLPQGTVGPTTPSAWPGATSSAQRLPTDSPEVTPEVGHRVVLAADYGEEPPRILVVDSASGGQLGSFSLPGLERNHRVRIAGGYVFYETEKGVLRGRPGGPSVELPFVRQEFLPAPDGERIVWGGCDWHEENEVCSNQISLASVDGEGERVLFEERVQGPIEAVPLVWSPDGRYLYVTHNVLAAEGGLFGSYVGLERIDTSAGEVVNILPGDTYSDISLSPDGMSLAYIPWATPLELAVRNMATGQETRAVLELGLGQAGGIVWSPSGNELMLTHAVGGDDYSIVRVGIQEMEQEVLLEKDDRRMRTVAWPSEGSVFLDDSQYTRQGVWTMDVAEGIATFLGPGEILGSMDAQDLLPELNPSALSLGALDRIGLRPLQPGLPIVREGKSSPPRGSVA